MMLDKDYVFINDSDTANFMFDLSSQVIDTFKSWQAEYRDCDKFSRVVQSIGLMSHAMQYGATDSTPAGLAIGVFNYQMSQGRGGHSINCVFTKVSGEDTFNIRFFEPQTGREVTLDPAEVRSSFGVLL